MIILDELNLNYISVKNICWEVQTLLDIQNYINREKVLKFNNKWKEVSLYCFKKYKYNEDEMRVELDKIGEWVEIYFDELDPEVAKMVRRARK